MELVEVLSERTFYDRLPRRGEWLVSYLRHRLQNVLVLAASDMIAIVLAFLLAGSIRLFWQGALLIPDWAWYLIPAWWIGTAITQLLPSWGLGPVEELRRTVLLLIVIFAGAAVVLFISKASESVSRITLTLSFLFSVVTVPFMRMLVKHLLIRLGVWGLPTVIYGGGEFAERIVRFLQAEKGLGYKPIGIFDDDPSSWNTALLNVPIEGGTNLVTPEASVAILAMPSMSSARATELLEGPLSYYRTVLLVPDLLESPSLWVKPRDLSGMLGLEITSNLINPVSRFAKLTFDVLVVLLTSPIWFPICATLAFLIWFEDRQSPFFLQERVGRGGKMFRTFKFRTMVPNAEAVLRQKLETDEVMRTEWETFYKLRKDPRITKIGRLLRRLSLDELPQLINVLRGEMSLVGPRPLPTYHCNELPRRVRELRERVRPGITGLWQVSGRSDTGNEGMEQWDPYYVRNWSLWLDAVILVRTITAVLKGSGAY
ncbi:MAG: undecaprenyl-phosphate galactose phosphotransferase WbaP [Rhodothermales bacterium]|nr:undecaprenyl-phosphate galactose phosphotransferase WbaP [Rhodothermales bacterium]